MLTGVALALSELPLPLLDSLTPRVHNRGGEAEVRFLFRCAERLLPLWLDGQLLLARWGSRRGETRALPLSGWTWQSTVEAGGWAHCHAAPAVIPATLGLDGGIWYRVRQGVRALAVSDERGRLCAYPIVEPSSHYYQVMTRSPWMPCLVGERI
jgi:hypothetical protein